MSVESISCQRYSQNKSLSWYYDKKRHNTGRSGYNAWNTWDSYYKRGRRNDPYSYNTYDKHPKKYPWEVTSFNRPKKYPWEVTSFNRPQKYPWELGPNNYNNPYSRNSYDSFYKRPK